MMTDGMSLFFYKTGKNYVFLMKPKFLKNGLPLDQKTK